MRKKILDHFCTLCGRKLASCNKYSVCFAHQDSESFQRLIIRFDHFLGERLGSFSSIFAKFLQLYKKPLIELAYELKVSLQTLKLWSQGQNLPAISVQRTVIRYLQKKIIKLRK